jgi:hypothetical protein
MGVQRFGPPLDHGDVVGATIEEEPEAETGIGVGDGDGSGPGWGDMSPELVARVEAAIEVMAENRASRPAHAALSTR